MNSNEEWLLTNKEEALEPNLPICDPHHHLWDFNKTYIEETYLLPDILKDTESGHNICLLYTSPSPRDVEESRMPSSA